MTIPFLDSLIEAANDCEDPVVSQMFGGQDTIKFIASGPRTIRALATSLKDSLEVLKSVADDCKWFNSYLEDLDYKHAYRCVDDIENETRKALEKITASLEEISK